MRLATTLGYTNPQVTTPSSFNTPGMPHATNCWMLGGYTTPASGGMPCVELCGVAGQVNHGIFDSLSSNQSHFTATSPDQ